MNRTFLAGLVYFLLIFAAGLFLGVFRALVVKPVLGETFGVILELPALLVLSWIVSRTLIDRFGVKRTVLDGLLMGGFAFVLVLVAEAVTSFVIGRTLLEHLLLYATAPGGLGLIAQIVFALFPAAQVKLARSRRR